MRVAGSNAALLQTTQPKRLLLKHAILSLSLSLLQDVAWSPTGKHFAVIGGRMPATSTLYNLKGEPIFEFGRAPRNTIRWSPHGRFLCLGGFGNLAGDMDIWDVNKKKKTASFQASERYHNR